ncbi:hypothetical protein P3342_013416 [Pyrenophora teres f. teres]|nr:hypothetical protein P3342_013416 [Pyrenophora teres f. teres]
MSEMTIEDRQRKANFRVVVTLTVIQEEDPENWELFENGKKEAQKLHWDRLAQREEAAKDKEGAPARKKGKAKQAPSSTWKPCKKAKKGNFSVV